RLALAARKTILVGAARRQRRVDDRAIAGAAAEIARERIVDRRAAGHALVMEREQRHHDAGRAEAALRSMVIDHRLLHRMQRAVGAAQILDRDKLLAV